MALSLKDKNSNLQALVTVAVAMQTLFVQFCCQDVPYKMDDFKGWEGAFVNVVDTAFAEYMKQDYTFVVKCCKEFVEDDHAKITLFITNLSDAACIQYLPHVVQFTLGTQLRLRGCEEHIEFKLSKILFDYYSLKAHMNLARKQ